MLLKIIFRYGQEENGEWYVETVSTKEYYGVFDYPSSYEKDVIKPHDDDCYECFIEISSYVGVARFALLARAYLEDEILKNVS